MPEEKDKGKRASFLNIKMLREAKFIKTKLCPQVNVILVYVVLSPFDNAPSSLVHKDITRQLIPHFLELSFS